MHSYKGKNNKHYHFNGDCSGDLIITEIEGKDLINEIRVDFQDIIDILKDNGYKVIREELQDKLTENIERKIVKKDLLKRGDKVVYVDISQTHEKEWSKEVKDKTFIVLRDEKEGQEITLIQNDNVFEGRPLLEDIKYLRKVIN